MGGIKLACTPVGHDVSEGCVLISYRDLRNGSASLERLSNTCCAWEYNLRKVETTKEYDSDTTIEEGFSGKGAPMLRKPAVREARISRGLNLGTIIEPEFADRTKTQADKNMEADVEIRRQHRGSVQVVSTKVVGSKRPKPREHTARRGKTSTGPFIGRTEVKQRRR